jgi:hypothetical protein
MIGGVSVDLVPMTPYYSSEPPKEYWKGNLPEPVRDSENSAVEYIEKWEPSETFSQKKIDRSQIGQLLWAGFGCTPHKTFRYYRHGVLSSDGQGKTIPSASASYTITLYVIKEDGVFKYLNWNDENGVATHSLGIIKKGSWLNIGNYENETWVNSREEKLLNELQQLLPDLPKVPTYIVVASNRRLSPYFSLMEAGYSVLHIILQAQALGMSSNIFVLDQTQMMKIRRTIGLIDMPIVIIPISN